MKNLPNYQELTEKLNINPEAKNQTKRQKSSEKPKIDPKARNPGKIYQIAKN